MVLFLVKYNNGQIVFQTKTSSSNILEYTTKVQSNNTITMAIVFYNTLSSHWTTNQNLGCLTFYT